MGELLFMKPYCKEVIWGGTKLKSIYGYETQGNHTGEAWVISANPDGQSVVTEGHYQGKTLKELWDGHRELFGNLEGDVFPLLIKLIDARDHLSIQVHPDDEYAYSHENGEKGKTECWYIVDCDEGADIVIGHKAQTKEELKAMIDEGRWDDLLNVIPIHKGDFFYIPAGTVHAIRKGTLILETQQNSNITYRLYDYGRLQDGKPRQLHIKQSLDVIRCPQERENTVQEAVEKDGNISQRLVSCPLFTVDHFETAEKMTMEQPYSFLIVDVLEGEGSVNNHPIKKGDHFIAPFGCGNLEFSGKLELITSHIS